MVSCTSVGFCCTGLSWLALCEVMPKPKITFGEMREMGVRGLLVYCSDYHCSHWTPISGDRWPDDLRLSDIEQRFTCQACGTKGADLRPDFHWERETRQGRNLRPNSGLVRGTSAFLPSGPDG